MNDIGKHLITAFWMASYVTLGEDFLEVKAIALTGKKDEHSEVEIEIISKSNKRLLFNTKILI